MKYLSTHLGKLDVEILLVFNLYIADHLHERHVVVVSIGYDFKEFIDGERREGDRKL